MRLGYKIMRAILRTEFFENYQRKYCILLGKSINESRVKHPTYIIIMCPFAKMEDNLENIMETHSCFLCSSALSAQNIERK